MTSDPGFVAPVQHRNETPRAEGDYSETLPYHQTQLSSSVIWGLSKASP